MLRLRQHADPIRGKWETVLEQATCGKCNNDCIGNFLIFSIIIVAVAVMY